MALKPIKYWYELNYQPQLVSSTGFLVAINSSEAEQAIWVARDESYIPKQTWRTKSQNHQNHRVDKTMKCQATNPIPHHVSQIGRMTMDEFAMSKFTVDVLPQG